MSPWRRFLRATLSRAGWVWSDLRRLDDGGGCFFAPGFAAGFEFCVDLRLRSRPFFLGMYLQIQSVHATRRGRARVLEREEGARGAQARRNRAPRSTRAAPTTRRLTRRARRDRSTTGAARRAKGCWWGALTTDKGARRGVKQQRSSLADRWRSELPPNVQARLNLVRSLTRITVDLVRSQSLPCAEINTAIAHSMGVAFLAHER